jgi:hypothetical protein
VQQQPLYNAPAYQPKNNYSYQAQSQPYQAPSNGYNKNDWNAETPDGYSDDSLNKNRLPDYGKSISSNPFAKKAATFAAFKPNAPAFIPSSTPAFTPASAPAFTPASAPVFVPPTPVVVDKVKELLNKLGVTVDEEITKVKDLLKEVRESA